MKSHRFTQALCAVSLLLAAGCQTNPGAPGLNSLSSALSSNGGKGNGLTDGIRDVIDGATAAFKDYSAADQQALGFEFSSVLLGARPLLRNDAVQRYVNQVGRWVAMQAERPLDKDGKDISFAWRFGVINSDAVNAYATPAAMCSSPWACCASSIRRPSSRVCWPMRLRT